MNMILIIFSMMFIIANGMAMIYFVNHPIAMLFLWNMIIILFLIIRHIEESSAEIGWWFDD